MPINRQKRPLKNNDYKKTLQRYGQITKKPNQTLGSKQHETKNAQTFVFYFI